MTRLALALALAGCKNPDPQTDGGPGTDGTDGTQDSTPDPDTAPWTDTGTPPVTGGLVFDDDHVLVIPDQDGLHLMANDGSLVFSRTWTQLVGNCTGCGGEGASADGDGLLLAFTTSGGFSGGAIARIDGLGQLDFRVDGFAFPHDAVRDPADGTILVPETFENQLSWIPGDGSTSQPVRTLDQSHPGWEEDQPNGIERLDHDGRTYLLSSHRGGALPGASGEITMWDITDPGGATLVWRFPEQGSLHTPHCPIYRQWDGRWWLVYAHSDGAHDGTSSIGLAVTDDPTVPPAYVADLEPTGPDAPFRFVRGVELTSDGWLYITDSGELGGFGSGAEGRIFAARMPGGLGPTGLGGDTDGQQSFVDLGAPALLLDGLANPFEGWLWAAPAL